MALRQKRKAANNACSWMVKTETKIASEESIACNNNQCTPNVICETPFDSDSVPSNSRMSAPPPQDVSTTTCCSSVEAYHTSLPQKGQEHSKNYFMMSSIPSSLMMPKALVREEGTGNWMSVLDRALSAGGATTDFDSIFNPFSFVDDIPITLNDAPISSDDIDNIFDD
jgi:hypothetical protein